MRTFKNLEEVWKTWKNFGKSKFGKCGIILKCLKFKKFSHIHSSSTTVKTCISYEFKIIC